jgi:hypothetical protein
MNTTDNDQFSPSEVLIRALEYLRRHYRTLLAGTLGFAVLGTIAFWVVTPRYAAKATLRCYTVKASTVVRILTALDEPVRERDTLAVGRALGLRPATVAGIRRLTVEMPKYIQPEDANEVLDVIVSAEVTRHALFDTLALALPRFIRNSPLVDSLARVKTAIRLATLDHIKSERQKIDSLRSLTAQFAQRGGNTEGLGIAANAEAWLDLNTTEVEATLDLQRVRSVFIVQTFIAPTRPNYPTVLLFVLLPTVVGLVLSIVGIELVALWRKTKPV